MNLHDASPQTTTENAGYRKPSLGQMCRPGSCSLTEDLRHAEELVEDLRAQLDQVRADYADVQAKLEHVQGVSRKYQQMLFGSSTPPSTSSGKTQAPEMSSSSQADTGSEPTESPKRRGAQKGHQGAGRKIPKGLPVEEIIHEVPSEEAICPRCGKPYAASGFCEESFEVAMEIRVYVKKHIRKRVFRNCDCVTVPRQITASKPANIIPKGLYDHSLLAFLLYGKYGLQVALTRLVTLLAGYGLCVHDGTIAGIFKKLAERLLPLYQLLLEQLQDEAVLYIDETGFRHFLAPEAQIIPDDQHPGKLAWLWVYAGSRVTVFTVEGTRSSKVLEQVLGLEADNILMSDGASAYQRYISRSQMLHSRCWAHFRRHFEDAAIKFPILQAWCARWLERIAELYTWNAQRLNALDATSRAQAQARLEQAVDRFQQTLVDESRQPDIHREAWKVLTSGLKYWPAYTVFVEHPDVAMDNNLAERSLRPGVLGRQNWYGVHAPWSGTLAAMMMSFIQTAQQHQLHAEPYLRYLLDEAAQWQEQPRDLAKHLPWNLDDAVCIAHSMKTGSDPPSRS